LDGGGGRASVESAARSAPNELVISSGSEKSWLMRGKISQSLRFFEMTREGGILRSRRARSLRLVVWSGSEKSWLRGGKISQSLRFFEMTREGS
jgi:hypothetical protein